MSYTDSTMELSQPTASDRRDVQPAGISLAAALSVILAPVAAAASVLIVLRVPLSFVWILGVALALLLMAMRVIVGAKTVSAQFAKITIPAVLFFLSTHAQLVFIENTLYKNFFAVLLLVVYFFYFRAVFVLRFFPEKYPAGTLAGYATMQSFIGIFFLAAALYGLHIFLHVEMWLLLLIGCAYGAIIAGMLSWWNGMAKRNAHAYVGIFFPFFFTTFSIFFLWPTSFYVNAFLVMSLSFLLHLFLVTILKEDVLDFRSVYRYGYGIVLLIIIVLATAQWS